MSRAAHAGWALLNLAAITVNVATFSAFPDLIVIPMFAGFAGYHAWKAMEGAES
jgi:hypothetical protein